MWLIRAALRRPMTVLVAVIAVALTAAFAVSRMRVDIFPDLDLPVIYVAQPYGGMSPAQMEGYLVYYYEYHFLYIHTHLARGEPIARGVLDASGEVVVPRLLAMLSVVAVFVPSFFITGVSRSLFVPLSLAVGFSMMASFFLSSS